MEIFNQRLLRELRAYHPKAKAWRVYGRCIRAGKVNLANRIARKYNLQHSDFAIAFGFGLNHTR